MKIILLFIILSALVYAQDRYYIEITPDLSWGDAGSSYTLQRYFDKPVNFGWSAALNIPINNRITIKPYITSFTNKFYFKDDNELVMFFNGWNCGTKIKIYLD